jgi:enterochelin esterase family protein
MNVISFFKCWYWIVYLSILSMINLADANLLSQAENCLEKTWEELSPQNSKGKLACYQFSSRILKNKRDIWIYTPASYQWKDGPYPLLIVFDGQAYTSELIPGPTILDNLIAENKIPPLVAVFISSIDQTARNQELPCYPRFIHFLSQELLPWISRRYLVTQNPSQTIVAGSSYGGLAAAYAALYDPQRFGNVLSQSGAFWWQPDQSSSTPWLVKQFESQSNLPIRFYLDVGDQETNAEPGRMNMIEVNRYLHTLLKDKGYNVSYNEFKGGHDYACWRKTFAIGLMALLKERK